MRRGELTPSPPLGRPGARSTGASNVPLASDSAAAVADYVNNKAGYYYLNPVHCPQSYSMKIKGSKLLSAGG